MMSRYDLVIFDCDGVLVDSERLAVKMESRILTEIGLWSLVVVAIIVAGIVVFEVRRRRREKRRIGTELAGLDGVAGDGASAVPDDEAVPADEEADPADDVDTPAHHEVVPADDMVTPVPADEARPPTPEVGG